MMVPIENLGRVGIIEDIKPHELAPEAFTSGNNIRFAQGVAQKFLGEVEVFTAPAVEPHWLLPWQLPSDYRWIYASDAKIYHTDGTTNTDITRTVGGDYTASAKPIWTGGNLHGVPVMNHANLTDYPQQWNAGTSKMIDLTNWPASTYCKVLRPFRNFLVALDITKSATRYPYMVKWSHPADPGTIPSSWDETDATKLAGEQTIAQTGGYLVDGASLGDIFVLYKEDAIWTMQFIGGNQVFSFREASGSIGALAPRCMETVFKQHFVVGTDDIFLFDGQTPRSVIRNKMRTSFFNRVSSDYVDYTFTVANHAKREIWTCFVEQAEEFCNLALVWNYDEGTWTLRDLPKINFLSFGQVTETATDTFDASTGTTFDADFGSFGESSLNASELSGLMAKGDGTTDAFYKTEKNYDFDGNAFTSYIERTGLTIVGYDREGNPKTDPYSVKFVRALYPKITSSPGATINIYVGAHDTPDGSVTWEGPLAFDPDTDVRVDCRVQGKFIAVRFEDASTTVPWSLGGYILDLDVVAHR